RATSLRSVSIPRWIRSTPPRARSTRIPSAKNTTTPRARCKQPCSATRNCATSSRSWAWTNSRRKKIQRFLSQPFTVAQNFTGTPGKYVSLKDTIKGFKMIVSGECDALPEQAFYMVGGIEEAFAKAEEMKKETAKK